MSHPSVHVLIINWNGLEHLPACFDSLLASDYPNARFVLLDNGSTDNSVGFVRERYGDDERVEVVECGANLGWSGGNNVGMARALEAHADYVFLLNNDTATDPGALSRLVEQAESDPGTGALAPKMLLYDTPEVLNSLGLEASIAGACWDRGLGRLDGSRWEESTEVVGGCGGAWFIRCDALRKTGLLPTEFGIYFDDLDLGLRIWSAGYRIMTCPEARVRHKFSATMGAVELAPRKHYLHLRNRLRMVLRRFPVRHAATVVPAVAGGELRGVGRCILNGEAVRAWQHLKAWGATLLYLQTALSERRRARRDGLDTSAFWRLLKRRPLFFPGIELPRDGWYPERNLEHGCYQPISSRARLTVPAGELRVSLANCYPALGPARIDIMRDGALVASLCATTGTQAVSVDHPGGAVELISRHVFRAEDTTEKTDIGGWVRIERV